MNGQPKLYDILRELHITFEYYEHPPAPTIEEAKKYWKDLNATHCKNLFFRNHKGDKHFLVILEHTRELDIHNLEKKLKQGKISFASVQRVEKFLGLKPGSISPFGLINDFSKNVHIFFDLELKSSQRISFHPNINTASLVVPFPDFIRYMDFTGNSYEFLQLYE